jgi:regulatory protein
MQGAARRGSGRREGPQPVTAVYLRNAAMHYLSGRAASESMLRQTLERRAKRRLDMRTLDDETKTLIAAAIADLVTHGLLNDAKFAEGRAASLMRKGFSKRRIARRALSATRLRRRSRLTWMN